MTVFILILLVVSALGHAVWNAISKKVVEKDTFFTTIIGTAVILYFPIAIYLFSQQAIPTVAIWYMVGSTVCELIYFYALAHTYQKLPLSYAYPIVRGLGPLVSTCLSFILGALFTGWGMAGILVIIIGILGMQFSGKITYQHGTIWAFLAGGINGCAITFDSLGASLMSGVLFKYFVFIGIWFGKLLLDHKPIRSYYRCFLLQPGKAIVGGLFTFGANAATQYALQSTPVGYVSATRELSIAFGTLIGWFIFKEEIKKNQVLGILLLIVGIILIKVGG